MTEEEVAEVVSRWTGIPVAKMLEGERDKLLRMEEVCMHERVVGQDEAVGGRQRRSAARAPACPTRTGRSAASCSWARPGWARPS